MSDMRLTQLVTKATAQGAVGAMATQKLPARNAQDKNTTAIQFSSIGRDDVNKTWGIFSLRRRVTSCAGHLRRVRFA